MIIFDYTDRARSPDSTDEPDFRVTITKTTNQDVNGELITVSISCLSKHKQNPLLFSSMRLL